MKIKTLLIAPYVGLKELASKLAAEQDELDVTVKKGDLYDAVPIVKEALTEGYELIISRGGTARILREHIDLPVIEIPVSGYDILRTLLLVKDSDASMELIGFPSICNAAASVCKLMDINLPYSVLHERDDAEHLIQEARDKGVQIVIGDNLTVRTAQKYGLQGILITSGRESILEAFSNALIAYEIVAREHTHSKTLESILDELDEGFAIVNQAGTLFFANRRFYEWTGINAIFSDLFSQLPELVTLLEDVQSVEESAHRFIIHGELIEFRARMLLGKFTSRKIIIRLNLPGAIKEAVSIIHTAPLVHAFTQLYAQSQEMKDAVEQAKRSVEENGCMSIVGEKGTEKKSFAGAIHGSMIVRNKRYIEISFNYPSTVSFERLEKELEVHQEATLMIDSVTNLSLAQQRMLLSILNRGLFKSIFVLSIHPEELLADGALDIAMYEALIQRVIMLPPLRRRIEDLEQMILIYLGIFNQKHGKQIVGFRASVLKALLNHPWPGNVDELEKTLDVCIQQTEGEYIDERGLAHSSDGDFFSVFPINLNQSLANIEYEIISRVMEAENMNQSRVANRLGISRSTLWRKLNESKKENGN